MALVKNTLKIAFNSVFSAMQDGSKSDNWMADQIGAAISTYISTGQVTSLDTGTAPAGTYTGAGTGIMTIDADELQSRLANTIAARYTNEDLAKNLAADIHAVCSTADTITTQTLGAITTPTGATSSSGSGKGKLVCSAVVIESMLQACFRSMDTMSSGGDAYLAAQFALAVDTYLKAGQVDITLQPPLSGSGAGGII